MALEILTFETGPFETNSFVVRCGEASWLIDPGMDPRELVDWLVDEKVALGAILLTHGHCDHIAGIADVHRAIGKTPVWCPADDAWMLSDPAGNLSGAFGLPMTAPPPDRLLRPGETLTLGIGIRGTDTILGSPLGLAGNGIPRRPQYGICPPNSVPLIQVLDTSGHTPGGVSFYCREEGVVFTGDSLFCRGIGRTDFPGGDSDRLLDNIRRHLYSLPGETRVYPGHGPATTIADEMEFRGQIP